MNPILRKLSGSRLTRSEVADLLEKHVGDYLNEYHCKQAYEAISQIPDESIKASALVIAKIFQDKGPCEFVKVIVRNLRAETTQD